MIKILIFILCVDISLHLVYACVYLKTEEIIAIAHLTYAAKDAIL